MDALKLVLSTKFMKNIITKILSKAIYKKTGYDVSIRINSIEAEAYDGKINVHMDANVEINSDDFVDILKTNDLI